MIEMADLGWCIAGLCAGVFHAAMVWRAAHRITPWTPLLGMLRLVLVAAFLIGAAFSGSILAATAGWCLGMLGAGAGLVVARPSRTVANAHDQAGE